MAVIAGVVFIIATAAGLASTALVPDLRSPDYLTQMSTQVNQVAGGALLLLVGAFGSVGIAFKGSGFYVNDSGSSKHSHSSSDTGSTGEPSTSSDPGSDSSASSTSSNGSKSDAKKASPKTKTGDKAKSKSKPKASASAD